jgi:hypothetical protein
MQWFGDARHSGVNTLETTITPQNVANLQKLFQVTLPAKADSAVVVLTNVNTGSTTQDLLFVNTTLGHHMALDAHTGGTVWSHTTSGINPTQSTPAIDPSRSFVYMYGLEGRVHKYAVGDGTEVTSGGWPQLETLKPNVEKGGSALTIASVGGTNYLYICNGGYDGDGGDYQGHVTTVNLGTGTQTVFNTLCSDQTVHFTNGGTPDCNHARSGLWARSCVVYDSDTGKLYGATGNGDFNPSVHDWGDSVFALDPSGVGSGGDPLDSYTPTNFASLESGDLDLGSTAPAIVPTGSAKFPHLAVQSGKDEKLRILNLDNLSGQGAPGHVAGELSTAALPQGGEVQNAVAIWKNPADGAQWVFVVSPSNGIAGLKLVFDGNGNPSLTPVWQQGGGGGSPLVANNVLYWALNGNLRALDPTTGNQLWSGAIGGIHWQSPVVANGIVYIADGNSHLTAFALSSTNPTLPRTGWTPTASNSGGTDVPLNAIDGNIATRWSTGTAMTPGMWFQVDMKALHSFNQITLDSGGSTNDFARGYQVFVSNDGMSFGNAIASGTGSSPLISIAFPTETARFIKVVQTGSASFWWSIAEFNVYGAGAVDGGTTMDAGTTDGGTITFPIQINFQPASAPAFAGYLEDTGAMFGSQGNGLSYGWNQDTSAFARQRASTLSPDERYDTLIHMQKVANEIWELAVPPGTYSVRIVVGDPSYTDSVYAVAAEGTVVVSGTPSAMTHWFDGTDTVGVTDGRLTITNAAGSSNNKIDFIVVNKL